MKIRWSSAGLFAFAIVFLLFGCAPKPIRIGFVGPLTGSSAPIGLGVRNGFLMALGDGASGAPGKLPPHTLLVKDDHNDPDACLLAMTELKEQGCSIVILGATSQGASKALPWALENGMLVISPTISAPVSGIDNALFVRINLGSQAYGLALSDIAFKRFGKTRVAVMGDMVNAGYVQSVVDVFTTAYAAAGGTVSYRKLFNSRIDKPAAGLGDELRANGSDGLLIVAASTEVALIAKQLEKDGLRTQLFLPPWPLTLDLIDNGGAAVEGAVAVSIADLEFQYPAGRKFEADYRNEYGDQPSFTAMFGYEAALILRAALATGVRAQPRLIRDRILSIGAFEGLQGTIRFDADGNADRELFKYIIQDGTFKSLD